MTLVFMFTLGPCYSCQIFKHPNSMTIEIFRAGEFPVLHTGEIPVVNGFVENLKQMVGGFEDLTEQSSKPACQGAADSKTSSEADRIR